MHTIKNNKLLQGAAIAAVLMGISFGAQAQTSLSSRIATGVGQAIAAQGNAALTQIRDELRKSFEDAIEPLLPEHDNGASAAATPDTETAEHPRARL